MAEEIKNQQQEQTPQEEQKQQEEIKSTILDDEELQKIVNDEEPSDEEPELPSEKNEENKEDELEKLRKEIEELKKSQEDGTKPNLELLKEMGNKVLSQGGLDDEDYSKLEQLGYDKDTVDIFIEGLKAKQQANTQNILNGVTTPDEYQEAIKYAGENWNENDIQEFNKLLDSGNNTAIRFAIKALVEEYRGTKENKPKDLHKDTVPPSNTIKGYETKVDMMKDMSDPRYGKDISYTKKVEQKIAQTDMSAWYK